MRDIRFAIRSFKAEPTVSLVAVLSLALAIGATNAIFALVNSLMLRPLPVAAPERLYILSSGSSHGLQWEWSYPVWEQLRQRPALFDGAAAWAWNRFDLAQGGETRFVEGLFANGSFFSALGVTPAAGRTFADADDVRGGGPAGAVAVISHRFAQRRFGGGANALGQTITLERVPFTVVGVMRPDFLGPEVGRAFDIIVPLGDEPMLRGRETWLERRATNWLTVLVRLRPDQSAAAATNALRRVQRDIWHATIPRNMRPEYRDRYLSESFTLIDAPAGDSTLRRSYGRALSTLFVVVTLVTLIACANVANLLLARGAARKRELSLQMALGASRWHLIRERLVESTMLCAAGTAVGAAAAGWTSRIIANQLSTSANSIALDTSVDVRILTFTIGAALFVAGSCGLLPALRTSDLSPIDAINDGRGDLPHRGWPATMRELLVAQIAMAVVLVVAAGLFLRTFVGLTTRETGLDRASVLLVDVDMARTSIAPEKRASVYANMRRSLAALPDAGNAAVSMVTPAGGGLIGRAAVVGGAPLPEDGRGTNVFTNVVSAGWFGTFGARIVAGRDFTDQDRLEAPPVAVINQTLARAALGHENPVGRSITLTIPGREMTMTIVGVAADTIYSSLRETIPPTLFTPITQPYFSQALFSSMTVGVRSKAGNADSISRSVAAAIREVNPDLSLTFRPLSVQLNASVVNEKVTAGVAGFLGVLALVLAALGLYGMTRYSVTQQRSEIGIRLAIGAAPSDIVRLVMTRTSYVIAAGILIGVAAAGWMSPLVRPLLYGVEARDVLTLASAAAILAAITAIAAIIPARRAASADPAEVLRHL